MKKTVNDPVSRRGFLVPLRRHPRSLERAHRRSPLSLEANRYGRNHSPDGRFATRWKKRRCSMCCAAANGPRRRPDCRGIRIEICESDGRGPLPCDFKRHHGAIHRPECVGSWARRRGDTSSVYIRGVRECNSSAARGTDLRRHRSGNISDRRQEARGCRHGADRRHHACPPGRRHIQRGFGAGRRQ